jgi:hypothetical protein
MAEIKPVKAVTPKGVAIYPRLNTPDDKFVKEGEYKVKLAFDADDAEFKKFQTKVEALVDEAFAAKVAELTDEGKGAVAKKLQKRYPFTAEEDPATGEETGRILISSRSKASGVSAKGPWSRKPSIINAKAQVLKNPPMIGGGSELKLSVSLAPYYAANDKTIGVSFRLEAVQVLTLVSGGARSASDFGFGEEDGDDVSDMEADSTFSAAGSDGDDDDDI